MAAEPSDHPLGGGARQPRFGSSSPLCVLLQSLVRMSSSSSSSPTELAAEPSAFSLSNLIVSRFPVGRPDPVRFFGIIKVFLGRFGIAFVFRKVAERP